MSGTQIDESLAKELKAAKRKARHFVLIAKGVTPVHVIVQKKRILDGDVLKAKSEFKGNVVISGVVQGSGAETVFYVAGEEPGIKIPKLREFLTEVSDLPIKPRFEVVTALPEVSEEPDGEEGNVSTGSTEVVPESRVEAPVEPVPPTDQGTDSARFSQRLKELVPDLKQAQAIEGPHREPLAKLTATMQALGQEKKFTAALEALEQVATLVRQVLAAPSETQPIPPTSTAPPPEMATFMERLKQLLPSLKAAQESTVPEAATLKQLGGQAQELGKQKKFAEGLKVLDEIERLLKAIEEAKKKKGAQTIEWENPADIVYQTPLAQAQLNARLTAGDGALTYAPALGTVLPVGDNQVLKVTAGETTAFEAATKEVRINVKKAEQVIDWTSPADITYGELLSATQLNAKLTKGDGALTYDPPLGHKLSAGPKQKLKVTAAETANYKLTTKEVELTVKQDKPEIEWKEPAAVAATGTPPKFTLTDTQLNATLKKGDGTLVYSPAKGAKVSVGTNRLRATHAATTNFESARKEVRLMVWGSVKAKEGYEKVRKGQGWKNPINPTVKNNWDNDVGNVKTQAKKLMSELSGMTPEEIKDYMDKQVTDLSQDYRYQPSSKPNHLWKFPNGLQVRMKPNGDNFSPDPSFMIEVRTSSGFSSSQGDIATKITSDGELGPKGPGDTTIVGTNSTEQTQYKDGTCAATHLKCRPKLDQEISWSNPADIRYGTPLSEAQLNATLTEGDGALTYTPALGTKLSAADNQTLKVDAAATKRYKAASKTVTINVKKATPVIRWENPADITAGTALSKTQLAAVLAEGDGTLVYTPPLGTKLSKGDGQILRVKVEATANFEAATKEVRINVK